MESNELRIKVAELCGWKPYPVNTEDDKVYCNPNNIHDHKMPDYPKDLNACHELILYLRDRGFWCEIKITIYGAVVCFRINDKGIGYKYEGTDKQLPVAICRAFVATMEGTKP
jgi:hypothetical protein